MLDLRRARAQPENVLETLHPDATPGYLAAWAGRPGSAIERTERGRRRADQPGGSARARLRGLRVLPGARDPRPSGELAPLQAVARSAAQRRHRGGATSRASVPTASVPRLKPEAGRREAAAAGRTALRVAAPELAGGERGRARAVLRRDPLADLRVRWRARVLLSARRRVRLSITVMRPDDRATRPATCRTHSPDRPTQPGHHRWGGACGARF